MIAIDASVFIDLLFEYNSARTRSAEELFCMLEEEGLTILEPEIFKNRAGRAGIKEDQKRPSSRDMRRDLSGAGLHEDFRNLR
jgi:predicted nucleic acid-binding protein